MKPSEKQIKDGEIHSGKDIGYKSTNQTDGQALQVINLKACITELEVENEKLTNPNS